MRLDPMFRYPLTRGVPCQFETRDSLHHRELETVGLCEVMREYSEHWDRMLRSYRCKMVEYNIAYSEGYTDFRDRESESGAQLVSSTSTHRRAS